MKKIKFLDCIELVGSSCPKFDGTKVYVSTGAVDGDHIDFSNVEVVDYESKPSRANLVANSNDILFAKMQATTKTLLVNEELSEHIYSTGFHAIRAKHDIISDKCLYYLLNSETFLTQKDKNCSGATQKAITNAGLGKITITVPSLDQQPLFVEQLDAICDLIASRELQLHKLDEIVQSRFSEMFGDPVINERNWLIDNLGNYMTTLTDFSANGSYELLDSNVVMYDEPNYAIMVRTTDLENGDLTTGVKYIDENAYKLLSKSMLFGGELIMNKIGSAGKIYIMPHIDKPASLGRNAFMFRFNEKLNIKFLFFLLSSEYGTNEIQQYVRGAVTKTITKDSTRAIRIIVPPIELQNEFAQFVEQIDKLKKDVQEALDKLETLKKSLMQKYFG